MSDQRPILRAFGNYDVKQASDETGLLCLDPSLTVQSQAEDADINVIVRRFGLTGELPASARVPMFQDYDGIFDFQSAQNAIARAHEDFMAIPADIRARFSNDPQMFLEFASDPANVDEMVKFGFAMPKSPLHTPANPEGLPPAVPEVSNG